MGKIEETVDELEETVDELAPSAGQEVSTELSAGVPRRSLSRRHWGPVTGVHSAVT